MINNILLGVERHLKRFVFAIFYGWTILWSLVEPIFAFFGTRIDDGQWYYGVVYLVVSLVIALLVVRPKKNIKFTFANTNTKVEILFGDLFEMSGHKVISANNYFDSQVGEPLLSPKSLHGIFLQKILGGHTDIMDKAVADQLQGKSATNVTRKAGKRLKYDIGETVIIKHDNSSYFLFALSESDYDCIASCNPQLMLKALNGLWEKIRSEGNGIDVNLPLVGSGLAKVGLPQSQILQLILISLLSFVKKDELGITVRIVLDEDVFEKIDLEIIKLNWV